MRKTFPEIENASLKNQGDKERTTVDMWVQKETRCLGWSVNKVWMPAFFSFFFFFGCQHYFLTGALKDDHRG